MDAEELLRSLQTNPPGALPPGRLSVRQVQENVFRVEAGGWPFLVKWIAANNTAGQNELRIGRLFARYPVVPAPRLVFEQPGESGTLAGWEWIDRSDLRLQGRENLIEAFTRLGELHRMLRNTGEVISPPNGPRYANVTEMLAVETYRLTAAYDLPAQGQCGDILARLGSGYATLIHGDMHPGNIIASGERVWFVDWSFTCNSLNQFDLDYVLSVALPPGGPAWAKIYPREAALALPAYFRAAGLDGLQYFQVHQAVMLWNLLRNYENCVINGYRAELAGIRAQIQMLLEE